ncbi:MAG: type transport system permease protein, partial [Thermoleophilaceae bacterium]|nr:type transport system permease protein [Thermoleophilaceae bacterium]
SKHLPAVLDAVARILPLRHVIDGLRGSILRGSGLTHHVEGLVVLAAWCVGGIFLALRYFRWE